MALRLRRGTDAERQLITPAEGELIYTTDTKSVYIGDGTTTGGIIISGEIGLGDLSEVDLSTPPTVGQVLVWDGVKFVPDNVEGTGGSSVTSIFDLNDVFKFTDPDINDILIFDGFNFVPQKIRIIEGADSSVMVNTTNNTFTGVFVGDGSGLTNLPGISISSIFDLDDVFNLTPPDIGDTLIFDGFNFVSRKITRIEGADSSVMVNTTNNTFTGVFVGDGSGLTNLDLTTSSILDLGDVFNLTPPDIGDLLIFNGFNFVPQKIRTIEGADSSVILDTTNNTFSGNFIGNLSGDVVGSVFSDDSNLVIEGDTGNIFTRNITSDLGLDLNFQGNLSFNKTGLPVVFINNDQPDVDLSTGNALHGLLIFRTIDVNGVNNSAVIGSSADGISINKTDASYALPNSHKLFIGTNGNFGFGTITPTEKFDFEGNARFAGTIDAASFKGSLVIDDSTVVIDGVNGSLLVSNIDIVGQTGNTPTDAVSVDSWLEVSVNGATKYIPLYS
jgi:hypothetical protein